MDQSASTPEPTPTTSSTHGPSLYTPSGEPNWKLVSFILLILLLLLIAVTIGSEIMRPKSLQTFQNTAVSISPIYPSSTPKITPVKHNDWKTYTNNEYTFNYPKEWLLIDNEGDYLRLYDENARKNPSAINTTIAIYPEIPTLFNGVDIDEAIGTKRELSDGSFEEKIANRAVDSRPSAMYKIEVSPASQTDAVPGILVKTKRKYDSLYIRLYNYKGANLNKNTKIFNQILSTFHFLDLTPSTTAASSSSAVSIAQTTINFAACTEGSHFLKAGSSRSASLTVKKDNGDTCQVEIIRQFEDTKTTSTCQVPKSLGVVQFTLTNSTADFSAIEPYCQ